MDTYSFKWIVMTICALSLFAALPWYEWSEDNYAYYVTTRMWQFLVQGAIPCLSITWFSLAFYQQLKVMRSSELYKHSDMALRKSIVRARISIWIAGIFAVSSIFYWVRLPWEVRIQSTTYLISYPFDYTFLDHASQVSQGRVKLCK